MHTSIKKVAAWIVAGVAAITMASVNFAAADNLNLCASGNGCLFRDANFWNLQASAGGGTGPHNVPWEIND